MILAFIGTKTNFTVKLTDSTLQFYQNGHAVSDKSYSVVSYASFKNLDIDFDGQEELITYSYRSINGNRWSEIYDYDINTKRVIRKGRLMDDFKIDEATQSIYDAHHGSWYMETTDSEYKWLQDSLFAYKHIIVKPIYDEKEQHSGHQLIYQVLNDHSLALEDSINQPFDSTLYANLLLKLH